MGNKTVAPKYMFGEEISGCLKRYDEVVNNIPLSGIYKDFDSTLVEVIGVATIDPHENPFFVSNQLVILKSGKGLFFMRLETFNSGVDPDGKFWHYDPERINNTVDGKPIRPRFIREKQ